MVLGVKFVLTRRTADKATSLILSTNETPMWFALVDKMREVALSAVLCVRMN